MKASASAPGTEWAVVTVVFPAIALLAIVLLRALFRAAAKEGERARAAVAACPLNDPHEMLVGHARIGGVVSLDGELLVELCWQPQQPAEQEGRSWLVAPANRMATMALDRWHESNVVVAVSSGPTGYLLRTTRSSVQVRDASGGHRSRDR